VIDRVKSGDRAAGALLFLLPLAFNAFFLLLARRFDYPDSLRSPTGDILGRFQAGAVSLKLLWYGFMLTAVAARAACRNRGTAARSRERVTGIPIGHPRTSALRATTAWSARSAKSAMPSLPSCVAEPDDLTQRCGLASGSELDLRLYGAS
jgi:hypothetical protein